jgi:hypothetical protein
MQTSRPSVWHLYKIVVTHPDAEPYQNAKDLIEGALEKIRLSKG